MAANIPDMGAIHHLGGQFNNNIFSHVQKHFTTKSKQYEAQHIAAVKQHEANRQKFARSVAQGLKQAQAQQVKTQRAQQAQAKQAQRAHAAGVKSGRVAPAQGAAPRTFAMGTTPQQKAQAKQSSTTARTMQQQRNFAHGEALKFQSAQFKTMQQQRNFAHGQAFQENKQRSKGGPVNSTATPLKAPSLSPSFSSAPAPQTAVKAQKIAPTTFSHQFSAQQPQQGRSGTTTATFSSPERKSTMPTPSAPQTRVTGPQFSDVSTQDNSPFPTHVHPAGSSNVTLPHLTASQPRPNAFTTGSRNVQPGGIAAAGSRLEAWANTKSQAVQARRKSAAAGGRDRGLAQNAREWEAAANQPLSRFAE